MISAVVRQKAQRYLLMAGLLGTLVVTPWFNVDPINVPKLFVIGVFAFLAFGVLVPSIRVFFDRKYLLVVVFGILFVLQMAFAMFLSSAPWQQLLFGTFGRNTGFIAYLSLVLLLLVGVVTSSYSLLPKLMYGLLAAGVFNALYGVAQWSGVDPIEWQNPYNSILGTLGNPNFASSFLGMSAIVAFALFFDKGRALWFRVLLVVYSLGALFLAYESDSIQGILVAAVGFAIVVYGLLKTLWMRLSFGVITLIGGVFAVLGTLQKGPLSGLLYQDSVTYRGDYWRAGLKMTTENPLTGVGPDAYGDYYRAARSVEATLRRGPDVTSNSAHNVFFDISASGGFPLLIIYLVLVGLVIRSAIRLIRSDIRNRWAVLALIGAWAAYLVQSIISINQLGLAVWGWILAGVIIGVDLNRDPVVVVQPKKGKKVDVPAASYLTGIAFGVLGLALSISPLVRDYSFKTALESGDKTRILNLVMDKGYNNYYLVYTSRAFRDNNLNQEALQLLYRAVENNPRDFNAWQDLTTLQETDMSMRQAALKQMRILDPNNPNIPAE